MATNLERLREALRWLLLPVPPDEEEAAVQAADSSLAAQGVDEDDRPAWVQNEHADWKDLGAPSAEFAEMVEAYIAVGDTELGPDLADSYFALHESIRSRPLFDHDRSSALLSHARLIVSLAETERLTSAQVTRIVNARDPRMQLTWQVAELILTALGLKPALDQDEVEALVAMDSQLEVETFADADDVTAIQIVADIGLTLGFGAGLREALEVLLPPSLDPFPPYLQMLHYQAIIAEFYDHQLSTIYEFSPRGAIPLWLFSQYPLTLNEAGNPFLNNAKSVDRLDRGWASSKKPAQIHQAQALVTVVTGLDDMGFAARKELASWLRRLIHRRMRLAEGTHHVLPSSLDKTHLKALCAAIARSESFTQGIIEQRLVDAVAAVKYSAPRWVGRGLGDSVNATNVSRRKLGDCDFQDGAAGKVIAYEAHAGRLTPVYVAGHVRTLRKALAARIEEWDENFGAGKRWSIDVTFVAHELALTPRDLAPFRVGPATVRLSATTYGDFIAGVKPSTRALLNNAEQFIRAPMSEPRTPDSARAVLLGLIA